MPELPVRAARRVCLLGGESSGKTTLAQKLAQALGTVWVAEYGRELWEQKDGQLRFEDLLQVGLVQVAREDEALGHATGWLICDTSPLTTLFYCLDGFGRADAPLEVLAARPYDAVLLCASDFAFVQDGSRRDAAFRGHQQAWYEQQLRQRGIAYTELAGSVTQRMDRALKRLQDGA